MTDLRAIAEAATPGPWEEFHDDLERGTWCLIQTDSIGLIRESAPVVASSVTNADAAHIAAWSPDRALAALDVIEAAAEVADFDSFFDTAGSPRHPALTAALNRWEALT